MAGQQDGALPAAQGPNEIGDGLVVEMVGRLIQDESGRAGEHGDRQREAAVQAGRERGGVTSASRRLGQLPESEARERLLDAGLQAPRVGSGHGRQQLVVVEDEASVVGSGGHPLGDRLEARRERADRRGGGIEPVADASDRGGLGDGRDGRDLDVAGVGGEVARDQAQESGLAAAIGADEAGPLAVADAEGDAVEKRLGAEEEVRSVRMLRRP